MLSASVVSEDNRVIVVPLELPVSSSCPSLTLWFRLTGPEIISGLLIQEDCVWSYTFPPPAAGEYVAVVKSVIMNNGQDVNRALCNFEEDLVVMDGSNYKNYSLDGAYMSGDVGCCDMCTSDPRCSHFTARVGKGGVIGSLKCIFYDKVTKSEVVKENR